MQLKIIGCSVSNVFPYYAAYSAIYVALKTNGANLPKNNIVYTSATNMFFSSHCLEYEVNSFLSPDDDGKNVLPYMTDLYNTMGWAKYSTK